MYTFKFETDTDKIEVSFDRHVDFGEFLEELRRFALAVGFQPGTISMYLDQD